MTLCLFFNDTATTEIYTLSLHDALPILADRRGVEPAGDDRPELLVRAGDAAAAPAERERRPDDRRQPDLLRRRRSEEHTSEPSHANISYAVFCLKKKNHYQLSYVLSSSI